MQPYQYNNGEIFMVEKTVLLDSVWVERLAQDKILTEVGLVALRQWQTQVYHANPAQDTVTLSWQALFMGMGQLQTRRSTVSLDNATNCSNARKYILASWRKAGLLTQITCPTLIGQYQPQPRFALYQLDKPAYHTLPQPTDTASTVAVSVPDGTHNVSMDAMGEFAALPMMNVLTQFMNTDLKKDPLKVIEGNTAPSHIEGQHSYYVKAVSEAEKVVLSVGDSQMATYYLLRMLQHVLVQHRDARQHDAQSQAQRAHSAGFYNRFALQLRQVAIDHHLTPNLHTKKKLLRQAQRIAGTNFYITPNNAFSRQQLKHIFDIIAIDDEQISDIKLQLLTYLGSSQSLHQLQQGDDIDSGSAPQAELSHIYLALPPAIENKVRQGLNDLPDDVDLNSLLVTFSRSIDVLKTEMVHRDMLELLSIDLNYKLAKFGSHLYQSPALHQYLLKQNETITHNNIKDRVYSLLKSLMDKHICCAVDQPQHSRSRTSVTTLYALLNEGIAIRIVAKPSAKLIKYYDYVIDAIHMQMNDARQWQQIQHALATRLEPISILHGDLYLAELQRHYDSHSATLDAVFASHPGLTAVVLARTA